jgi:hypothetical protein
MRGTESKLSGLINLNEKPLINFDVEDLYDVDDNPEV